MNEKKVILGKNVKVGSHCTIIKATIGDHSTIGHHVFIGKNVKIGKNVTIEDASAIADNCTVDDGVTVPFASKISSDSHLKK